MEIKLTIAYDNETKRADLIPAWGFACVIESGKKILFDCGWDGNILSSNLQRLGCGPEQLDAIFLSHQHWDHIGGLPSILPKAHNAEVIVPGSFSKRLMHEISRTNKVRVIREPQEIFEGVYSTGVLAGACDGLDIGEQSAVIESSRGFIVVAGCSHPGVEEILDTSRKFGGIHGIIGGFHGFDSVESLKGLELIVPTHCTQHKNEILAKYPGSANAGGVGWRVEIK
jgi:7,8-dihydropterin-6-yl-methyl-4-(beta-D-ribofuranosyl)aminobenzene 5'-phosphate synthase